jgi:hypothetical protein
MTTKTAKLTTMSEKVVMMTSPFLAQTTTPKVALTPTILTATPALPTTTTTPTTTPAAALT